MKIVVFGATGNTGSKVVESALKKGYSVTAFVRNRQKVGLTDTNLSIVEGDVLSSIDVASAIKGKDAVVSSLGAGLNGNVRSMGTFNIVEAMKKQSVSRLISQSTLGAGESRNNLNAFWKYLMFGVLLRRAYIDHNQQEDIIRQSDLNWTIVRPGSLTNDKPTGKYRHGFPSMDRTITLKISAADVADFMVNQLTDESYIRAAPGLSY